MKIAIVEDTKIHVKQLESHLDRYQQEEGETFEVFTFSDGLKFLDSIKQGYDIIFMDINMPYIDGMETAKRLREIDRYACLIFITELSQYAISGYEVAAFDFVVKPVLYEMFRPKLAKAIAEVNKNNLGKLCIRNKDVIRMVKIQDIYYIETVQHKIIYHLANEDVEVWDSLDKAESRLPPGRFARCGTSYLVNLAHVVMVKGNTVTLPNTTLPISRLKKKEFIDSLIKFTML